MSSILVTHPRKKTMTIHEKIRRGQKEARKQRDKIRLSALTVLLGELQRIDHKNDVDDQQVVNLIMKLIDAANQAHDDEFAMIIAEFIPEQVSKDDVRKWIKENINFGELKNKMQAVGLIKNHFGASIDGKTVSEIIKTEF